MIFSPLVSLILDLLRFCLALTVLVGHLSQRYFQSSWPDLSHVGIVAVGSFFVLSGLVIRGLQSRHPVFSISDFYADRASRLLSVALIALVVTGVCDAIAYRVAPDFYWTNWGFRSDHPVIRILASITLFSEPWGYDIVPFSNSPFWSLGYESGFYVLWGLMLYAGQRRGLTWMLVLAAILYGPNVVLMMLFWYLGVHLYGLVESDPTTTGALRSARNWIPIMSAAAITFLFSPFVKEQFLGGREPFSIVGLGAAHVSFDVMIGATGTYIVLFPILLLATRNARRVSVSSRIVSVSRFLGEVTFPLYLVHFPLLVLARCLDLYDPESFVQKILVALVIVLVAAAVVPLGAAVKRQLRSAFKMRPTSAGCPSLSSPGYRGPP